MDIKESKFVHQLTSTDNERSLSKFGKSNLNNNDIKYVRIYFYKLEIPKDGIFDNIYDYVKYLKNKKFIHTLIQFENGLVFEGGGDVQLGYIKNDDFFDKRKDRLIEYFDMEIDYNKVVKKCKEIVSTKPIDFDEYNRFLQTGIYLPAKTHKTHTCATSVAYALGFNEWWTFDVDKLYNETIKNKIVLLNKSFY